eukprot:6116200-Amphidinium_carterae.1
MTVTSHCHQPTMLMACVVACLRTKLKRGQDDIDAVLNTAAEVVNHYLKNPDYTWPEGAAMNADELCNQYPAIVAREFMCQLRGLLRWLSVDIGDDDDAA